MSKRIVAFVVAASVALGLTGCSASLDYPDLSSCEGRNNPFSSDLFVGPGALAAVPVGAAAIAAGACDSPAAAKLRPAAERGDAKAQFQLGARYAAGQGVPQDGAEAARWYQKSADQGYGPAQIRLGVLYEKGFGVPQDNVQADMWYQIVGASHWSAAIEQRMTPEQIAEARKRAQNRKPAT